MWVFEALFLVVSERILFDLVHDTFFLVYT